MSGPLLWDVDTQVDFVHAQGKLPVPDAEAAAPAMARLVRWAEERGIVHLATADDHELTDPEISDAPDYATTFPPHCLRGTPGAAKIPETAQRDPLPISLTPYPPGLRAGARPRASRAPRPEEDVQRVLEPQPRAAPRRARPGGGDPLRRRHGRLQPRRRAWASSPGVAGSRSSRTPRGASPRSVSRRRSRNGARAGCGSRPATRWLRPRHEGAAARRPCADDGPGARLRVELPRRGRDAPPRARCSSRCRAGRGDRHGSRGRHGMARLGAVSGCCALHGRAGARSARRPRASCSPTTPTCTSSRATGSSCSRRTRRST